MAKKICQKMKSTIDLKIKLNIVLEIIMLDIVFHLHQSYCLVVFVSLKVFVLVIQEKIARLH